MLPNYDFVSDSTEETSTRFVTFITPNLNRFDLAITKTGRFYGKKLVTDLQKGITAIIGADDLEEEGYLEETFRLTEEEAAELEAFLHLVIGPAPGVTAALAAEARKALAGRPQRALVADDSAVARNQIRRALEDIGVEAILCNDGTQALERLTRWAEEGEVDEHISMVISDIEMPQMDGYTLVREIRKNRRLAHLHVMMHSSLSGQFNSQACKAAGADQLLAKFAPDEFARAVTAWLGRDGTAQTAS